MYFLLFLFLEHFFCGVGQVLIEAGFPLFLLSFSLSFFFWGGVSGVLSSCVVIGEEGRGGWLERGSKS